MVQTRSHNEGAGAALGPESKSGFEPGLRDYFAAHCPESEIMPPTWGDIIKFKGLPAGIGIQHWKDEYTREWRCAQRYAYADAMLGERDRILKARVYEKHEYVPHPEFPWFCEQCGYAAGERLQHKATEIAVSHKASTP